VGGGTEATARPVRRCHPGVGGGAEAATGRAGFLSCVNKASGVREWAERVGVEKFPISGDPTTFGDPMGETRRK
jgi:hypothetical protein